MLRLEDISVHETVDLVHGVGGGVMWLGVHGWH